MTEQRRLSITNDVPSRPLSRAKIVIPYTDKGRLGLRIQEFVLGEQEAQTPEQLAAQRARAEEAAP